jgi:hypothetical protein
MGGAKVKGPLHSYDYLPHCMQEALDFFEKYSYDSGIFSTNIDIRK